jgi:hypothetical protein
MAVNVAVLKKVAVDLARSGREGLQESYKVGGGFPPLIHYNTTGHWKGWARKLMYIKLPMYLFFYMALGLK